MPTRQVTFNMTSLVPRTPMVEAFVYDIQTPIADDVVYFRTFLGSKQWRIDSVS